MYTCGPTVYDYAHIGNFRTFTFMDILQRWLRASGFGIDHVMNITDVDDKIVRNQELVPEQEAEYRSGPPKARLA
jgi:cysteinyl-tRNA synthetase